MKGLLEKLKVFLEGLKKPSSKSNAKSENSTTEKADGRLRKLLLNIKGYAKRKPSTFIVIVIGIVFVLLFVTYESLHLTSTPNFCGLCHVETETGAGAEYHTWKKNIHSYADVTCIDCHGKPGFLGYVRAKIGGLFDLYGEFAYSKEHKMEILEKAATSKEYAANLVPNDWCLVCHSDDENKRIRDERFMSFFGVKMRKVDAVKNPAFRESNGLRDIFNDEMANINFDHGKHIKELNLSCMSCHKGVAHGGEFKNKIKMEDCFNCHDAERSLNQNITAPANEDCATCHKTVVATQEGVLLLEEGEEPNIPSMMQDQGVYGAEGCTNCHIESAFDLPSIEVCGSMCHGTDEDGHDVDYGFMFEEIRNDFDDTKAPLDDLYMQLYDAQGKMNKEQKTKFNKFKDYYDILANDNSKGIHNDNIFRKAAEKANEIGTELASSLGISVATEDKTE